MREGRRSFSLASKPVLRYGSLQNTVRSGLFFARTYPISKIVSEAKIGKGAVFHYFKSKLDLAREALANLLRGVMTRPVIGIVRSELPVEEKVEKLVELSLRTSRRYNASSLAFMINIYAELEKKGKVHFVREMYRSLIEEISTMFVGISERPGDRARILGYDLGWDHCTLSDLAGGV